MSRDPYAALLERALRRVRQAKAEVAESRRPPSARCPVAIVAHACRLPGADDPEAFWALLRDGVDAIGPPPPDRWPGVDWYDPTGADPERAYVEEAGYLRDLAGFDPEHFGIGPREAATMDPQQRLLLELAWEALERAGLPPGGLRGSRTGVYVGASNHEYGRRYTEVAGRLNPFVGTSGSLSVMAGRVAYALGLEGPAMAIDTACSSALVAIALGVRALQAGDCDRAICGGANAIVDPYTTVAMCSVGMLSRGGRCRSFDAGADGFARGEGCGLVVLERLDDARRAGRPILAVIRGVAVNQDGRSAGLTAPNAHAQVAVIRAALADGALDPRAVAYVESHGTGTALGDPIEMRALGEALCADRPAETPLLVGAAKSNIGHLESAAGVAGLIKATLALGHGQVPPNLHFAAPNPHIAWDALPVRVPTAPMPLGPGLVGISAFGLSGTNAHVVIGPPPAPPPPPTLRPRARWIVPLSARTPEALAEVAARSADRLAADPDCWPHLAGAAALTREPLAERATVVAADADAALAGLRAIAEGRAAPGTGRDRASAARAPRIGFVFTGQGAQYAGMGRALYAEEPVFAAAIDRCAAALAPLRPEPLTQVLFGDDSPIDETRWTQPALFALGIALAELWASLGVRPHAVAGHSVGAFAAAVVAGALDLDDGLRLVAARAELMGALPAGGAMATVSADERRVLAAARGARWVIAAVNAPDETVISGEADAIDAAIAAFARDGIAARRLVVSHAFHSPAMEPMVDAFRARAAACAMRRPALRFVDDRTGALRGRAPTADDWAAHLRAPVRFADALRALAAEGCDALVELGPRPALLAFARRTLGADCPPTLPSLRPGRPAFAESLAALWRLGAPVDWAARFADRGLRPVALPTYPFQRRRLWFEAGEPAASAPDRERFTLVWRPRPPAARPRSIAGRWLVVGDGGGLGPALLDALRAAGAEAEGAADAAAARGRIAAEAWTGVLDLGALDGPAFDPAADPAEAVRAARAAGCDGALSLIEALDRDTRLVLVSRRAVAVGAEPPDPLAALRAGLARVVIQERPGARAIDVDAGPPPAVAAALCAALADDAPELALRGDARLAPRLAPLRPDPVEPPALAGPGTILITGGLGALGLAVAGRLIARGADVTLMGRNPPSAEARARIDGWRAEGAAVRAVAGDVTRAADVERVAAALAEAGAPIAGVVHAAGVLDDALLPEQDPARLDRVIGPKLLGAWHLHRVAPEAGLFVVFSSVVGLTGNAGQANYAAANAALDAFAAWRAAGGRPTRTIRWGPWHERGMTAGLDLRRAKRSGVEPLPEARALAAFERALADREPAPVILALGDPPPALPLFADLAPATPAGPTAPAAPRGALRAALDAAPPEARPPRMLDALIGHVAAALGLDPAQIDADRAAVDHGLDSLLVIEVLDALEHDLGLRVYPREFYTQPSLRAMADYLLAELAERADEASAALRAAPDRWKPTEGPLAALAAEADPARAPDAPVEGVGFVLSAPRSGSTLLRTMLQGHPALFAPPELWLLVADDMAARARHLGPLGLDDGYTLALREARGCTTEEAEAEVAALVAERAPTWAALARLRRHLGARWVIDKSPLYAQFDYCLDRVARWFAPGPLIHLVRHPLAVIDSIVRTRLVRLVHGDEGAPWFVAEGIWTTGEERIAAFAAAHPDRPVVRVHFEALVTRPRETLEGLCDALGLAFDPAMLDPYGAGRMTGGLRPGSAPMGDLGFAARGGVDPALAEAWRGVEPPAPLNARTRAAADALGYALPARRDRVAVPSAPAARPDAAEAAPGPRPLALTVGRLRLAALAWGPDDGPLVLAVHGLLDHAGVWAPLAARLAARGLCVVAPDLRGHGASGHVGADADYGLLEYVHDLETWRARLGGAGPAVVIGHSMGAAIAATHAAAADAGWPLVLVEPPMPAAAGVAALGGWLEARKAAPVHPVLPDLDAAIARLAGSMPDVPPADLRPFAARAVESVDGGLRWRWDPRLRLRAGLALGGLDADGWLALLGARAPAPRLVFGADSRLVRPRDRDRQAAAVEAGAAHTLPGGHHLPLTAAEALAGIVGDTLG